MSRLVKKLDGNRAVVFDVGSFDSWCVYVVESNGTRKAPLDVTYFSDLLAISKKYHKDKVYDDFVRIYDQTTEIIDPSVLDLIDDIVKHYNPVDRIAVEQWFVVIYAGMIAEENKAFAKLKKRVKRLGMHQVLKLGMSAIDAAHFSRGKPWRDLDKIMRPLGF